MPSVMLTDRFVRTAKPRQGQTEAEYFDAAAKGLSLYVSVGGSRTFFVHYRRPADARRARWKLGTYPELTLSEARHKAREARGAVSEGQDPAAEDRAERASLQVHDLVESYIARHAASRRSHQAIARRLRKNVSAVVGDVKLSALHRRDLTRCIDRVVDRGAATEANRVFEDLRAMIRWARSRGDLDHNLVDGMRRPSPTIARERVLSTEEIRTFWARLPDAEMREGTRRILRLCLITAARVGELAGMRPRELDLARRTWTIPADRSKNHREHELPLSDLAVQIFQEQLAEVAADEERRGRRWKVSTPAEPEWVFPGPGARKPITGQAVAKAANRAIAALGVAPFTPHDLRRTAATGMEELGIPPFVVAHVLGHVSVTKASVTSRVYAQYDYAKEKREAVELWAARLEGLISTPAAAEIVQLGAGSR